MNVEQFEAGKLYKKLSGGGELIIILSAHVSSLRSDGRLTTLVRCIDCYGVFHTGTVSHRDWMLVE